MRSFNEEGGCTMIISETTIQKMSALMEELRRNNEDMKPPHRNAATMALVRCSCKCTKSPVNLKGMNKHLLNK
mgnify:CR=1 FL=1